jgi:prolyl-tRNA synthetase
MRQSHLFTKTRREAPTDEVSKNAQLLIRAGYIHKEMAGVYDFLPLGHRVLEQINHVIREEMTSIGGQEVLLSSLQEKELWHATDRWDSEDVDVWFKTLLQNGTELGLGFTHEEPIARMMKDHIHSYRDLPQYVFQIQTKFRNEVRAKSGIMRTREFPMKDLYSFSATQEDLDKYYEQVADAYERIFHRVGIGDRTYKTFASGGAFAKYSHEYQTLSEAGEDVIYIDDASGIAINEEVYTDAVKADLGVSDATFHTAKSIEVGNIFKLGTRFSEPLGLVYTTENGSTSPVVMGSYGIGPSRLLGTVAEVLSDEKGLVWPEEIAPFAVHVVRLGDAVDVVARADALYTQLTEKGVQVLYDDRALSAGEKFADSDLLGIPQRVIVSGKTLESGQCEVVARHTGVKTFVSEDTIFAHLAKNTYSIDVA